MFVSRLIMQKTLFIILDGSNGKAWKSSVNGCSTRLEQINEICGEI